MTQPRLKLTLVGIQPPADNAAPIPLTRYDAFVSEHTPSHSRPRRTCWDDYQPTPVVIPPARRTPPPVRPRAPELSVVIPSRRSSDQVIAGLICIYLIAIVMIAVPWLTGLR